MFKDIFGPETYNIIIKCMSRRRYLMSHLYDTIILGENERDLQTALDSVQE